MEEIKLGRIESVDLRSIWTSEDRHFTPWLAKAENLEILGEVLGIELELEAQEKFVGPFRADLLCKNTADDSWILIENQIEKTDHKHLGQLLTYAAGLEAVTIVWISAQFCEEHRAALDWLNQKTDESIRLFGLEVELWKIGNSPAAPRFKIISKPNDWSKTVRQAATGLMETPSETLRIKYWTALRSYLQENKSKLRSQKPAANHWYNFGIGTSKANLAALIITRENKIGVELIIKADNAKEIFKDLFSQKEKIESVIGSPLEWREMLDKKASRIVLFKQCDPANEDDWKIQFQWMQSTIEKFDRAFRPYLNPALS